MNNERLERNIALSKQSGRVHIAIDFTNQIHNFKKHKTENQLIFDSNSYQIFCFTPPIKDGFFTAQDIHIYFKKTEEDFLLEDYAFYWTTSPERKLLDFDSNDFLEQTCITHSVWRIQDSNNSLEPFNDYLRDCKNEDDKVYEAIINLLKPRIELVSQRFFNKYRHLDYGDIYSRALNITSNMIIGENKKHIQNILYNSEKDQMKLRSNFRENSINTIKKYKNGKKERIDLSEIRKGAFEEIIKTTGSDPFSLELSARMLMPDNFSTFVSESLSYNSPKIYKVWLDKNLVEFIFGVKKGFIPLYDYLKDYFKNDIKKYKKGNLTNSIENFDDYTENDLDNNLFGKSKKWKSNQNNYTLMELEEIKNKASKVLKGKQKNAYLNWLNNNYDSSNQNERQNLNRAKEVIKKLKIDIPTPKSQSK